MSIAAISLLYIFVDIPINRSDTANWNTYYNKEYGFSFQYPKYDGHTPVETDGRVCVHGSCISYQKYDGANNSHILSASTSLYGQEYDIYYWRKFIFVDNILASMYIFDISVEGGSYKSKRIFLRKGRMLYAITDFDDNMLSTVKFQY